MKPNENSWSNIIAGCIESNLNKLRHGDKESIAFVLDMSDRDPALYDPRNIADRNLAAAWNFADTYFDAASHCFADMDSIPWNEATDLLESVVTCLRAGTIITDPRVLRYA